MQLRQPWSASVLLWGALVLISEIQVQVSPQLGKRLSLSEHMLGHAWRKLGSLCWGPKGVGENPSSLGEIEIFFDIRANLI